MNFHGVKEWRSHLPSYKGKKIIIIPVILLATLSGTLTFYYILDNLPRWFPTPTLIALEPWLPIIGPSTALTLAYLSIYSVWSRRRKLLARDKATAYEKAFIYGITGVLAIFATIIHLFDPIIWSPLHLASLPPPANPLTSVFASSVFDLLSGQASAFTPLPQMILGTAVSLLGLLFAFRSVETFGFDYVTVVYLYYPEESRLVDNAIYGIVRNPVYGAAILAGFGGVLFRCSLYAVVVWVFLAALFVAHIEFVEDRELVERFGDSFREYQRRVPALIIRPRDWGKFALFLIGRLRAQSNPESSASHPK